MTVKTNFPQTHQFDGLIGGKVGYWLLRRISKYEPAEDHHCATRARFSSGIEQLQQCLGVGAEEYVKGRTVVDYGCGSGEAAVGLARMGASSVIGIDILDSRLEEARELAQTKGVADRCQFINGLTTDALTPLHGSADLVISIDAFEHYQDPAEILDVMWGLTRPGGHVFIWFGPTWWHPHGSHVQFMGAPPWVHLMFKEETIMDVRSLYRDDGAKRFEDIEGGLNRMTITRFEELVSQSKFKTNSVRCVPIKGIKLLTKYRGVREFFSSGVRANLQRL